MLDPNLKLNQELYLNETELKSCREAFGTEIAELAEKDKSIVVLCADLKDSIKLGTFATKFPERYIEVGIAEQNMAGIATGLALSNKIPFMVSHAIFSPSTNWAQIRLSVCFSNANVKIISSHSGFSNGPDGGAAEPFEDIALMRVLPNMKIIQPVDYEETKKVIKTIAGIAGPVYIRLSKAELPAITTKETPFILGKAMRITEGKDITLITSGPIAYQVILAAKELKTKHNINAEILVLSTIKPLDEKSIVDSAKKTLKVMTIEEHQITGGLGSAVAEVLSEKLPTPIKRLGMKDKFSESGTYTELLNKYRLSSHNIVEEVLEWIS